MKTSTFITASLMLAAASAIPAVADANSISIVQKIAPKSNACAGGEFPDECATADQATSALIQSFNEYNIVTPGEQSALISLMAFETGDFKYVRNHYPAPGRPGQVSTLSFFLSQTRNSFSHKGSSTSSHNQYGMGVSELTFFFF